MNETRDITNHDAYQSCLENVLEERGYASNHMNLANRPTAPESEWASIETEAKEQARDTVDAGECGCCEGSY